MNEGKQILQPLADGRLGELFSLLSSDFSDIPDFDEEGLPECAHTAVLFARKERALSPLIEAGSIEDESLELIRPQLDQAFQELLHFLRGIFFEENGSLAKTLLYRRFHALYAALNSFEQDPDTIAEIARFRRETGAPIHSHNENTIKQVVALLEKEEPRFCDICYLLFFSTSLEFLFAAAPFFSPLMRRQGVDLEDVVEGKRKLKEVINYETAREIMGQELRRVDALVSAISEVCHPLSPSMLVHLFDKRAPSKTADKYVRWLLSELQISKPPHRVTKTIPSMKSTPFGLVLQLFFDESQ